MKQINQTIDYRKPIQYKEGQQLLFDSSLRAIPFNIIMASLLAIDLYVNNVPGALISTWIVAMIVISLIRMLHCKIVVSRELYNRSVNFHLKIFICLCFLTGCVWTSIYFASIDYAQELQLYVIILVFGGMAAGATTTLSVYFPAFLTYILTIFIPVTIYNYSLLEFNHAILATMFLFFLLAITIIGTAHNKILQRTFYLTEQNKILSDKFEKLSITDALTGLFNRRHFTKVIEEEYNRAKRNQQSFSWVSIDVDNFKLINDTLGHPFGDKFLIYVAKFLKSNLKRANDIIFRLGGDEFALLLINVSEANTIEICNKIQADFLKNPEFTYESQRRDAKHVLSKISLSMGVMYVPYQSKATIEQIIERADQSLYHSKNEGKNRIKYAALE